MVLSFGPKLRGQLADILDQDARLVLLHLCRSVGKVETAHVGRHCVIIAAQILQLPLPAIPELRKAMQEQDQRPLSRMRVVQAHAVDAGVVVANSAQCAVVN